ncbi:uncharacterized protein MELLADRAFT_61513 [Melampsora larici-populina 98AG31]|uniref:Uncharacterized protein n=1 Tax=Melampsora larici-populina (strain 98AG31 / pathotype 3-4-7) TaxID=747676 RepID=F4RF78_MELLP|nr:uncharacterized protein MELLADRAFT_61513 [Melampsora larici-populina 98AG31]EGG08981.1 hypothetical protein MELLADRAFT_61513 [Melampsora larici-populina 98AG31]
MPPRTRNRQGNTSNSPNQAPAGPKETAPGDVPNAGRNTKRPPPRRAPIAKRIRNDSQNDTSEPAAEHLPTELRTTTKKNLIAFRTNLKVPIVWKLIPEVAAIQKASAYTLFLKYCVDCLAEPMPLKAQDDGDTVLGDRNRKNGERWDSLSDDERAVFHPTNFYALAGVPNPLDFESDEVDRDDDDEQEDDRGDSFVPVPTVHKLSIEEDELYRPIYKRMVDLKKVTAELEKPPSGPSNSQLQRKSKTAIEKISHQLACEANRLDFAYYLVATSTVTPNKSKDLGWLKEFTTHPQVATWANDKLNLAAVFATYSQGESMAKAIASTHPKPKRQRSDKLQPSDKIKIDLGRLLAGITLKTLGYLPTQSFPQTADPVAELKKRSLPIGIILEEGSRLTDEKLMVGFKKMRSAIRLEWINDIKDGLFRLVELRVGSEERIGEPVVLNANEIKTALATPAREIDKAVAVGEITASQGAENEGEKNKKGSGSSSEGDSEDEE